MKVKVTHKECFARQTVRVFKKVGKLIENTVRKCVLFAGWRAEYRYRINWLVVVRARSAILASSQAGRSQASVCSMMSMLS